MNKRVAAAALSMVLGSVGLAVAQVHGVPAGATSVSGTRPFANPPGVPAGATSLGPRGFAPSNQIFHGTYVPVPTARHDGRHTPRVVLAVPVPLYGYGYGYSSYYPYSYSSTETVPADYRVDETPMTQSPLTPQPIVVAPVQQPPQVIVIDNRGVRDATDEEKTQALAARKAANSKQEEPKIEAKNQPEDEGPMTVLVFRDGTRKEIKNYAIMGKELIVLGTGSMRRIQIAELDLPATMKENDVRGLDFKLP